MHIGRPFSRSRCGHTEAGRPPCGGAQTDICRNWGGDKCPLRRCRRRKPHPRPGVAHRQGPPVSLRPQRLRQEAGVALPVPGVWVMIPCFPLPLQLSSQGPRGLCNKVRGVLWESRKYIKSQGPLGTRGKRGPDSHNREYPASDHTNNRPDSLTGPDRATDGRCRSSGSAARGGGAAALHGVPLNALTASSVHATNVY